jgi:negative regulator of flagellin synthesis FlgM
LKITSTPLNNTAASSVASARPDSIARSGALQSAAGAAGGGKGAVDLSAAARHLSGLENTDNDINIERITQIRDAIASGQLKIDTSRIADSLIASVRDLLK